LLEFATEINFYKICVFYIKLIKLYVSYYFHFVMICCHSYPTNKKHTNNRNRASF